MYLGRKKVNGRSYESGYKANDYRTLTENEKEALVILLRSGDKNVRDDLVLGHIGLVMSIVSRYASRCMSRATDMEGVASVALVEAVDMFAVKGINNTITPYIVSKIHSAISNYLDEDRPVKTTRYGIAKAIKKAKREGGEVLLPSIFSIDAQSSNDSETDKRMFDDALAVTDSGYGNLEREDEEKEFKEKIDRLCLTCDQVKVLKGLLAGKSEAELAREMGCTRNKTNYLKKSILEVIKEYYGDSHGQQS